MNTPISRRSAIVLASSVALAPLVGCDSKPKTTGDGGQADAAFKTVSEKWLNESARLNPVGATGRGDHRYDAELNDVSAAGRQARADVRKGLVAELAAIDRTKLSRENQVDAVMLNDQLEAEAFNAEELQSWAWDPLTYSDLTGGSVYSLMARDFAPLAERLISAASRMEKMPELLIQTRGELVPERVPLVHAETYARQNSGAISIIDDFVLAQAGKLSGDDKTRLTAAAEKAKAAIAEHQKWIDTTLVPGAKGDFRVGAHYDKKLRFSIDSPIPKDQLLAQARADLDRVTTEMYAIAREVMKSAPGGGLLPASNPPPELRRATVAAALAVAAKQAPPPARLFEEAKKTLDDTTKFVRDNELITLPDAPVKVIEMPKFQQGVSVAYCDSPGPLDRKLDTFYAISPIPKDWTKEQTASFLKEYNTRALNELTIHEAMPGHYVQLWHSNKHPSVLRAVLGSGSFIEGWAVYAQDVMIAAGHGGADPLRKLVNLKWALRVISNTILDQGVHVEGWDEKKAMDFMVKEAFQEEREAAGKWTRARVSSGQLASYYVGWTDHLALRKDYEAKQGAGFNLKTYHDALLSHGSPPARLARAMLFDSAIA